MIWRMRKLQPKSTVWMPKVGWPFGKLVGSSPVDVRGHPIVCYTGELCTSVLRILRAPSTRFPVLRKFLIHVTTDLSGHRSVCDIDSDSDRRNTKNLLQLTALTFLGDLP